MPGIDIQAGAAVIQKEPLEAKLNLFDELATRFDKASRPDFDTQIDGWRGGRCFFEDGSVKHQVPLLIADKRTDKNDPSRTVSKGFVVWWQGLSKDFFKEMTPGKSNTVKLKEDSFFADGRYSTLYAIGKSLVSYALNNDGTLVQNEFRTDGAYTYVRYDDNAGGEAYCYF
ncbi:MAG: hypothetical protein HQM16_18180 [Deltaproteobacteria bacterium]|nr:hypothetical protein [Deltaproteobacteria bacterium]